MHGVNIGVLRDAPAFPKVKVRSQPRGSFSVAEYRAVVAAARRLRGQPHPVLDELASGERFWIARELLVMPQELPWLIRWMVNTFVRPSDIKLMKHRHIDIVRGKHVYLRMNLPETKRHSQPIVSLRPAVRVYECLLAHRREQGFGGAEDYIFMPQLRTASTRWPCSTSFSIGRWKQRRSRKGRRASRGRFIACATQPSPCGCFMGRASTC